MKRQKNKIINLRALFQKRESYTNIQHEIETILDRRLRQFMNTATQNEIIIIVGKGHNSYYFIEGKNQLRYFAENYLNKLNIRYKNCDYYEGGQGAIKFWL